MNNQDYFNDENYTGNHLHVDNWKYEFTPYIEAIAWVRKDSSMDLFLMILQMIRSFKRYLVIKNTIIMNLWVYFLVMLKLIRKYTKCFVIGLMECYTHLGRELNRKERIFSFLMVSSIYHCINVTSLLISIFYTSYLDVNAFTFKFAMITL